MLFTIQYWGHNLKSRILCTVLLVSLIALVYNNTVYAATTWPVYMEIAGSVRKSDSMYSVTVLGQSYSQFGASIKSVSGLPYAETYDNYLFFDVAVPVNLLCVSGQPRGTSFSFIKSFLMSINVSNYLNSDGDVVPLQFMSMSADCADGMSIMTTTVNSGKSFDSDHPCNLWVYVRGDGVPFMSSRTAYSYVHFYFCTTRLGGSGLIPALPSPLVFKLYVATDTNTLSSDDIVASNSETGKLQDIQDTIEDQRDEDRDDAGKAGDDASGLVTDLDSGIKSKWEILWYPIKFTQQVLQVFTGGTASAYYQDQYGYVSGYTYNDETGCLDPVIDKSRASPRSGGSVITWPAFDIMGMQVWDSYDFDLAQIKSYFPALFDALYVGVSILELYWFVGFLRDKYEEVFGG